MKNIQLWHEPIPEGEGVRFLYTADAGGVGVFLGTTRRWTDGRETERLSYECYEAMALAEMQRIADAACDRWPVKRLCLWHRLGDVPAGEASVLVGIATPHRAEAFAACRYLIDTLKAQVPIWKRERYTDGTTEWVEGQQPALGVAARHDPTTDDADGAIISEGDPA